MKFKYLNVYNTDNVKLLITYKKEKIIFTVKDIIQKKTKVNKEKLTSDKQFHVLESFLTFKGDKFKVLLFKRLVTISDVIIEDIISYDHERICNKMVEILSMFKIKEIEKYLKNVYGIIPPSGLLDEFKNSPLADGFGSRVQTYLKSDYFGIASLSLPAKIILGPLGEYAMINKDSLMSDIKEYNLINMVYNADNIFQSEPAVKLLGLLEMTFTKNSSNKANLLMDKMIPSSDVPLWLFSVAFLKKLTITNIIDDTTSNNIITECYNTANGLLTNASSMKKAIHDKKPMSDGEDTESLLETYRMATDLSMGVIEEFNLVLDRPHNMLKLMGLGEHEDMLNKALLFTKPMRNSEINNGIVIITSWIISDILDSRSLWYVDINRVVNAIAVAFTWLIVKGHKRLALLMTMLEIEEDGYRLSQKVNRTRIPKEELNTLKEMYALDRVIMGKNGESRKSPIEGTVNLVSDEFYKKQYVYTATNDFLGETSREVDVPFDLKPILTLALLDIAKI